MPLASEETQLRILDALSGFPLRLTAVQTPAADYNAAVGDFVQMNSTTGEVIVNLPTVTAANKNGQLGFTFVPIGAGNGATINAADGDTVNGVASIGMSGETDIASVLISNGLHGWETVSYTQIPV